MKILVIIVTYNAMHWAKRCFDSLQTSTIVPDVYVVDNGSTDGTQTFVQENYPKVIFQQSNKNLGFGAANNIGLKYALDYNYDYVYLLNQDAWVLADTIEKLISFSIKYKNYGIISPFQMNSDTVHIDKNFIKNVCSYQSNQDIFNDFYNKKWKEIYDVNNVMAAHWFMPISTIKKIGGFSPSFPHYGEDDNYAERVLYHKMKIGVIPSLRVVHDRGDRIISADKMIHIAYTSSIKYMSSPFLSFFQGIICVFKRNLGISYKLRTLKPIKNIIRILLEIHKIRINKQLTMNQDCVFLSLL